MSVIHHNNITDLSNRSGTSEEARNADVQGQTLTGEAAKQYAFLRHHEKETILVVANFDDHEAVCNVNVPQHAFEHLGIATGDKKAVELISRQRVTMALTHENPLTISIQPFSAVFWKFK